MQIGNKVETCGKVIESHELQEFILQRFMVLICF